MNELEMLREALHTQHAHGWVTAALTGLTKPGIAYVGKSTKGVPASSLVRIYSIKLEHVRKRGHVPVGMEPLLDALRSLPGQTEVTLRPFVSDDTTLIATFWYAGCLIGCIVGESGDADDATDDRLNADG